MHPQIVEAVAEVQEPFGAERGTDGPGFGPTQRRIRPSLRRTGPDLVFGPSPRRPRRQAPASCGVRQGPSPDLVRRSA